VISAILNYTFKDKLKESSYREVGKVSATGGGTAGGQARLFVAKGHTSNMNAAGIIDFIVAEAEIDGKVINDVRVYDNFSFITLPAEQAELVLMVFSKNKRGGKPLVTRAKERESTGGGGGRSYGGGGGFRDNRSPRGDFRGERNSDDRKPFGDRAERSDRPDRVERKDYGGERERRPVTEKKLFSPKPEFKKEYAKREEATSDATGTEKKPVRKRDNKLTDYLEKKPETEKKPASEKKTSVKKKGDTSVVDEFMKKFDDTDLSW
jgi:hypothetical protein